MSFDFPQPLRLAVGSHQAGSGRGCAMNVISYENGDKEITDFPACSDNLLTKVVQNLNDSICKERDGLLLCPDCSIKMLELAHRTVGTFIGTWFHDKLEEGWRLVENEDVLSVYKALAEFEGQLHWVDISSSYYQVEGEWGWRGQRKTIEDAHRLIDKFEELTGIKAKPVPAEVTEQAVTKMREKVDA